MNTKPKTNWWIDLALFTGFIAAFFLDFTGVDLHQWIGVIGGALASYHLVIHWEWAVAVGERFFGSTSGKARFNFIIDSLLLIGFALIVSTGLVISTWLDLTLGNPGAWLSLHILASIGALLALVVKLGLHWRWIARTAQSIFAGSSPALARSAALPPAAPGRRQISRGEFLKVMGVAGAASFVALVSASSSLAALQEAGSQAAASQAASLQSTTADASASSGCTVRCERGCSYPGHCRRYVDSNNNNRCDLGECL